MSYIYFDIVGPVFSPSPLNVRIYKSKNWEPLDLDVALVFGMPIYSTNHQILGSKNMTVYKPLLFQEQNSLWFLLISYEHYMNTTWHVVLSGNLVCSDMTFCENPAAASLSSYVESQASIMGLVCQCLPRLHSLTKWILKKSVHISSLIYQIN